MDSPNNHVNEMIDYKTITKSQQQIN